MASFSNYFVVEFIGAVFALICAAYIYLKYVAYKYWSWKNIDSVKPVVPFGNLWPVISVSTSIGELFRDIYLEFRKSPVVGVYMFHKPTLVVNDPDLIRFILTKQFANFHDRGVYCDEKVDPLSGHLFSIPGAKWKFLRTKFSPTFTSSKMKQMFFTIQECSETMVGFVSPRAKNRELIEVKDLVARFSTDVIASAAFGIQCNSIENPNADFRSFGRKVFRPKPWMNLVGLLAPSWLKLFRISSVDADVEKFFLSAFMEAVKYRTDNNVARKDFLDLIIQLMNKGYIENDDKKLSQLSEFDSQKVTALEGAAQAFVFWLAGFETSSSTVTNCLYELALHQDIQDKVAEEANRVLGEFGGMSYNGVKEMRYLYKVVSETLRKYPAVPILNRECTTETDLPETGLHVEKGTAIIIPVYGIHNDPEIYPDPEKFDPERFTEENIASRHPYAYLPFGEGPRNCIGMRFGLVQTQVALASLLSKYRFTPGPDVKVPMVMDRGNVGIAPAGGMTLRVELRLDPSFYFVPADAGNMAFYSKYFLVEFIGAVFALICAAYIYLKYVTYKYWSWKNIDFVKPVVPFGNLWPVLLVRASIGERFRDIYLKFRKSRVVGVYMFHKPALVVNDPDLIRFILTKQFANFHDRGTYCNEKTDPLSGHLFAIPGAKWKFLRTKFSPTFTLSKMKQMFFTVQECSEKMVEFVGPQAKNRKVIDVKDLVARFSTDVIASVAFGIQCNSIENPNAEFREYGRKVLRPRPIMGVISLLAPSLLDMIGISNTDADVEKFFISAFTETVEYRAANSVVRKDFLDLIIQLMNKGHVENDDKKSAQLSEFDSQKITLLEGAAQAFVFWLAGFETSSSTVTHCLYELALHQDIQDKVAEEVNGVLAEFGGMSYNGVKEMRYLYKVVSETLRKYPVVPILNRECTTETDLPETGLHVEKGTAIIIPVFGIHNDPEIYPDPDKFDPERFTEENIASRHPYSYLPFGEGPRNCIGMRFGLVQTQVALASLLSKYRFTPGADLKVPMVIDKASFGIAPEGGITLRIEQR
ncbi:uncharacterized protein LOC124404669 [Diprion similis]|uniref:uncharacterized protein LOC124404669 n=1 Tax=Diprion similis TaxID=362088 RepID=UPI001EF8C52C|nr:uncharacterized protein LOC124404669 [Diprion similis]